MNKSYLLALNYLKSFCLIWAILLVTAESGKAQYYNNAYGKTGATLKTALHSIIKGHTVLTYSDLWTAYNTTDNRGGNEVWDIYSDIPGGTPPYLYTLGADQCGTYNSEGDCYNREHTWPQYYFNGVPPMHTDLQQVFPTDGFVNGKRGNFPYGKVTTPGWTSDNGSKTGSSTTYAGYLFDVFEPIDSFKGDIARIYFYMSTRYEGEDAGWLNWEMANGAVLTTEAANLLMSWHTSDPVSAKEQTRNEAVYLLQGNRNPFIDYPVFADCIWGGTDCSGVGIDELTSSVSLQVYPHPVTSIAKINHEPGINILRWELNDIHGQKLIQNLTGTPEIDMNGLNPGFYVIKILTSKGIDRRILIKQ